MADVRYSDKRLTEPFSAYVLFNEPLEAASAELIAAVAEDFPELDWGYQLLGDEIDTRTISIVMSIDRDDPTKAGLRMTTHPGRCEVDWEDLFQKNKLTCPDACARVAAHTDHLSIWVESAPEGSDDDRLARRFDAARRLTCLVAVLAKLPITTAIYYPGGDLIAPPEVWIKAADEAISGSFPVLAWINLHMVAFNNPPEPLPITLSTIGMAAFTGEELLMPHMRMRWQDALPLAATICKMRLELGHEFGDGNTLGPDGVAPDDPRSFRVRHVAEGRVVSLPDNGAAFSPQTDQWWFFHSTCPWEDEALLGPRALRPPPPGVANEIRGSPDAFKNKLSSLFGRR